MRVLHLINDLDVDGGAQRIVRDLVERTLDCEPAVLTLKPAPAEVLAELEERGVVSSSLRPLRPSSLGRARRLVREADVVHVHLFPSLYLGALLSRPKVFTEHNTTNRRRSRPWLRPLERRVYRRYDRVGCISEAARGALAEWVGDLDGRLEVVVNGIRLDRFRAATRPAPQPPFRLLMTAGFTAQKDQASLVRALEHLPASFELHLVGEGVNRSAVEAVARQRRLESRVVFHGRLPNEELPRLLSDTDLYVQSSHWEGFGLAPVEAMAAGIPAVGGDVAGLAEVIGDPALLFPAGDDRAMARVICTLLEDPARYEHESARAGERAARYDCDVMAAQYRAMYASVAGSAEPMTGVR